MAFEFIENNGDTECFAPTTTTALATTRLWLDRWWAGVPRHDHQGSHPARSRAGAKNRSSQKRKNSLSLKIHLLVFVF